MNYKIKNITKGMMLLLAIVLVAVTMHGTFADGTIEFMTPDLVYDDVLEMTTVRLANLTNEAVNLDRDQMTIQSGDFLAHEIANTQALLQQDENSLLEVHNQIEQLAYAITMLDFLHVENAGYDEYTDDYDAEDSYYQVEPQEVESQAITTEIYIERLTEEANETLEMLIRFAMELNQEDFTEDTWNQLHEQLTHTMTALDAELSLTELHQEIQNVALSTTTLVEAEIEEITEETMIDDENGHASTTEDEAEIPTDDESEDVDITVDEDEASIDSEEYDNLDDEDDKSGLVATYSIEDLLAQAVNAIPIATRAALQVAIDATPTNATKPTVIALAPSIPTATTTVTVATGRNVMLVGVDPTTPSVISQVTAVRHFTVSGPNSTLSLVNVTLDGHFESGILHRGGVSVNTGGHLIMGEASTITRTMWLTNSFGVAIDVTNINSRLTMLEGSSINGNTRSATTAATSIGSAVRIAASARFDFYGGEIRDNLMQVTLSGEVTPSGGAVQVTGLNSVFVMHDEAATIINNEIRTTRTGTNTSSQTVRGGGVSIEAGARFEMNGGAIENNRAQVINQSTNNDGTLTAVGGGVFVSGETSRFEMNGGIISENAVTGANPGTGNPIFVLEGGGIEVSDGAIFDFNDGIISGNEAGSGGGITLRDANSTLNMHDGQITGNYALDVPGSATWQQGGGGVLVRNGRMTMSGGNITNNQSFSNGGGIYVSRLGRLELDTGNIHHNNADVDGGAIFTALMHYAPTIEAPAYENLTIGTAVSFTGNTALIEGVPPINANTLTQIASKTTSVGAHLLNNYDINFRRSLLVINHILLTGALAMIPPEAEVIIEMGASFPAAGNSLTIDQGRRITLTSSDPNHPYEYTRTAAGRHFNVTGVGSTFTLQNVIVDGGTGTHARGGIAVTAGGALYVIDSTIRNNRTTTSAGAAIDMVGAASRLVIEGSTLYNNTTSNSNGVSAIRTSNAVATISDSVVRNNGTNSITVNGGELTITDSAIRNNDANAIGQSGNSTINLDNTAVYHNTGVGVNVTGTGTFNMYNASRIEANNSTGIVVSGGSATVSGALVNITDSYILNHPTGSGINITGSGQVVMHSGQIAGNTMTLGVGSAAFRSGGGGIRIGSITLASSSTNVGVNPGVRFIMHDGIIEGNSARSGGGIYVAGTGVNAPQVHILGGTIRNNTATFDGGGIFVEHARNKTDLSEYPDVYNNLYITDNVVFSGNSAISASEPPPNASDFTNIQFDTTSEHNHPLNNYDINFFRTRYVTTQEELRTAVNQTMTIIENTISLMNDFDATGNAVVIASGGSGIEPRHIHLTSYGTTPFTYAQTMIGQRHFIVGSSGRLRLENVILDGRFETGQSAMNNRGGVSLTQYGALIMEDGAVITRNRWGSGGAVLVQSGDREPLTMNPGSRIDHNVATGSGGGISVNNSSGTLNIHIYGEISNNRAMNGGGVSLQRNTATNFNVNTDGKIVDNTATDRGGGIVTNAGLSTSVVITLNGGRIAGNTASSGGGVFIDATTKAVHGRFVMNAGIIEGNHARNGGGIYLENGNYIMELNDGTLRDNEAIDDGGAIFTERFQYAENLTGESYTGFTTADTVWFTGNFAANGSSLPPNNASIRTNLAFASYSTKGHILNNYDINFHRHGLITNHTELLAAIQAADPDVETTLVLGNSFTATWNVAPLNTPAIPITGGRCIRLTTVGDEPLTYTRNASSGSNQRHFLLSGEGSCLILDNVILDGELTTQATRGGVVVGAGTSLIMEEGSQIIRSGWGSPAVGRWTNANVGGAVRVEGADATFTMHEGSLVSQNFSTAIAMHNGGHFTMYGGIIANNRVTNNTANGGGVFINDNSTMVMYDGLITNNHSMQGGGVYVANLNENALTIHAGILRNNSAEVDGGAIFTRQLQYDSILDGLAYANISIAQAVRFEENSAFRAVTPPTNATDFVGSVTSTTIYSHPLNNHDINFGYDNDVRIVNEYELRDMAIVARPEVPTTVSLWHNITRVNTLAINIDNGRDIHLTSWHTARATYFINRLSPSGLGRHFVVTGESRLTLEHVILDGDTPSTVNSHVNRGGIMVQNRSELIMLDQSTIQNTRRTISDQEGIAVHVVGAGSRFEMHDGSELLNNTNNSVANNTMANANSLGGGIRIQDGAIVVMYGGRIAGNRAGAGGGGVHVAGTGSRFIMHDGIMENNTLTRTAVNGGASGGAIYIGTTDEDAVQILGGAIRNNTSTSDGGAIFSSLVQYHHSINHPLAFSNLVVANTVQFSGNEIVNENPTQIPNNHADIVRIQAASSSVDSHPLNNFDINNPGAIYVGSHAELVNEINSPTLSLGIPTTIAMTNDFPTTGNPITVSGNQQITFRSAGDEPFVYSQNMANHRRHFYVVGPHASLDLYNVILDGTWIPNTAIPDTNNRGGVDVSAGGSFTMGEGSTIRRTYWARPNQGGAVQVSGVNTTFDMVDGTLHDNHAHSSLELGGGNGAGGVLVQNQAQMTMRNGTIRNNGSLNIDLNGAMHAGGILINNATLDLYAGTISDNHAVGHHAGGLWLQNAVVNMGEAVVISGNTSNQNAGGLYVGPNVDLIMDGVSILANRALRGAGMFTMTDELEISDMMVTDNAATIAGGGIYIAVGEVTLTDAEILGNEAVNGGGIYVRRAATLTMNEGRVMNNTAAEMGGGIFTEDHDYSDLMLPGSYGNLNIYDVYFNENQAEVAHEPPFNTEAVNITALNTSVYDHPINNYDINFEFIATGIVSLQVPEVLNFGNYEIEAVLNRQTKPLEWWGYADEDDVMDLDTTLDLMVIDGRRLDDRATTGWQLTASLTNPFENEGGELLAGIELGYQVPGGTRQEMTHNNAIPIFTENPHGLVPSVRNISNIHQWSTGHGFSLFIRNLAELQADTFVAEIEWILTMGPQNVGLGEYLAGGSYDYD